MTTPRLYLGVDPGLSGAMAVYDREAKALVGVYDVPTMNHMVNGTRKKRIDAYGLARVLDQAVGQIHQAMIEDVHAMPKQGVTSAFSFGRSFGVIEGLICSLQAPLAFVSPAKWKRAMRVSWEKDSARDAVTRMFPHVAPLVSRATDHNRAEAILIAIYAAEVAGNSAGIRPK